MLNEKVSYDRIATAVAVLVVAGAIFAVVVMVWFWPQNAGPAPTYATEAPVAQPHADDAGERDTQNQGTEGEQHP